MRNPPAFRKHPWSFFARVLGLCFLGLSMPADGASKSKSELQVIMQDLSSSMAAIQVALWRDDWPTVAQRANAIKNHAKPSVSAKARIVWRLGLAAPSFYSAEEEMQAVATRLMTSARGRHPAQVVADFNSLQQSCVRCHSVASTHFR